MDDWAREVEDSIVDWDDDANEYIVFPGLVSQVLRDERERCAKIAEDAKLDGCAEFRDRIVAEIRGQDDNV